MLVFDEAKHAYQYAGRAVPGVTSILKPVMDLSMIKPDVLERARLLGQAVHLTTELYDRDDLDESTLSPELRPYLDAWIKFREDCDFQPIGIEGRVFHPTYRYAGTYDRTGYVRGHLAVLDIKKMMVLGPAIGLQLAAYREAYNATHSAQPIHARYALGLRPDGTYRLEPYIDPADWPTFLSLLTIHNWKAKHGK